MPRSYFIRSFDMTRFFVFLLFLRATQVRCQGDAVLNCQDLSARNEFEIGKAAALNIVVPNYPYIYSVLKGLSKIPCEVYNGLDVTLLSNGCYYFPCNNVTIVAVLIPKFSRYDAGIWSLEMSYGTSEHLYHQIEAYETEYDKDFNDKIIEVKIGEYMVINFREIDDVNKNCTLINEGKNKRYNLRDVAYRFAEHESNIRTVGHCGFHMLVEDETQGNWSLVSEFGWKRYKANFRVQINSSIVKKKNARLDFLLPETYGEYWVEGFEESITVSPRSFDAEYLELVNPGGDIIRLPEMSGEKFRVGPVQSEDNGTWTIRVEEAENRGVLTERKFFVIIQAFSLLRFMLKKEKRDQSYSLEVEPLQSFPSDFLECTMKYRNEILSCEKKKNDYSMGFRIIIPSGIIDNINDLQDWELSMEFPNFHLKAMLIGKNAKAWKKYYWHSRQMQKYVNQGETLKVRCISNQILKNCSLTNPQGTKYNLRDNEFVSEIEYEESDGIRYKKIYGCETTIQNVNHSHNGTWKWKMDFGNGREVESLVPVQVIESDLIPEVEQTNNTDGTVFLHCRLSPGKRFRKIVLCEWFHGNDSFEKDSTNYTVWKNDRNCSLGVKSPIKKDIGLWKCSVRLDIGGYRNATVKFPKISVKEEEQDGNSQIGNQTSDIENFKTIALPVEQRDQTTDYMRNESSCNDTPSREKSFLNFSSIETWIIILLIPSLTSVVIIGVFVYYYTIKKKHWGQRIIELESARRFLTENRFGPVDPTLMLNEQAIGGFLPYKDEYEFPCEKLIPVKILAEGNFGKVEKCFAPNIRGDGKRTAVAVKKVLSPTFSDIYALVIELKVLCHLQEQHPNIVNLLGACTKNVPGKDIWILLEYCRFGSLEAYIKKHKSDFTNIIDIVICGKKDPRLGSLDNNIIEDAANALESANNTVRNKCCSRIRWVNYLSQLFFRSRHRVSRNQSPSVFGLDAKGNSGTPRHSNRSYDSYDSTRCCEEVPGVNETKPFSAGDLLTWASQVAHGMEFLGQKKVLHGDLAARNVLLTNDRTAKICDFGLARSIPQTKDYYRKKVNREFPVINSAMEVLEERKFSTRSDVWSFGILVWELFTLGEKPYKGLKDARNSHILLDSLKRGNRLEIPRYATDRLYKMMLLCWEAEPNDRPSFSYLSKELKNILEEKLTCDHIQSNSE